VSVRHNGVTNNGVHDGPAGAGAAPTPDGCATAREVLNRVGDKWSVFAIARLGHGTTRFTELQRGIEGISQRMLTLTLRHLERDGLVTRTVYPTIPPRVDYALTPLGRTLLETVMALAAWAEAHRVDIEAARHAYDQRQAATAAGHLADGPGGVQ
jgi:DNA-binding HxlR family transcriptional regulator